MKQRLSAAIWGLFFILAAAFILVNQFSGFENLGAGSIIALVLSAGFIVHCIATLNFSLLPFPLALLYIIFQAPLELPFIRTWILIVAAVLSSMGLKMLMPFKFKFSRSACKYFYKNGENLEYKMKRPETENISGDNNPAVSVNFGAVSRRFNADKLETVQLQCSFGALEIYLDGATLSPNGAAANLNCNFGAIQLYVSKDWVIINNLNCSLGGVDIDNTKTTPAENAPRLTLNGNVSMGGVEVVCI